jgi:nitrite reductase/ring-hydroxylating ferredoxin subunit
VAVHQVDDFSLPEEGELVAVAVDGTDVAVAVLDGQLHAFDDTCPHAGCSLTEGGLEDQSVVCPCHFARFDITTGAVVEGSAASGVSIWTARFQDDTLQLDGPKDSPAAADSAPAADRAPASPVPVPDGQAGSDRDITVLIVREHDSFRRQFAALEQTSDPQELQQAWSALADLLEIHASGEEAVLYPTLVRADEQTSEEAEHAVRDHNEIRHSVRAVQDHAVGSAPWWQAVRTAREVNEDHLSEEEADVLPPFRDRVDPARRQELGSQWVAFHREHAAARGLSGADADPHAVIERQQ